MGNGACSTEVKEGGPGSPAMEKARNQVFEYFFALEKTFTAHQEKEVLIQLSNWLKKGGPGAPQGYKLRLHRVTGEETGPPVSLRELKDIINHKHPIRLALECPYFPPVTPWVEFNVKDTGNLKYLIEILDTE